MHQHRIKIWLALISTLSILATCTHSLFEISSCFIYILFHHLTSWKTIPMPCRQLVINHFIFLMKSEVTLPPDALIRIDNKNCLKEDAMKATQCSKACYVHDLLPVPVAIFRYKKFYLPTCYLCNLVVPAPAPTQH